MTDVSETVLRKLAAEYEAVLRRAKEALNQVEREKAELQDLKISVQEEIAVAYAELQDARAKHAEKVRALRDGFLGAMESA